MPHVQTSLLLKAHLPPMVSLHLVCTLKGAQKWSYLSSLYKLEDPEKKPVTFKHIQKRKRCLKLDDSINEDVNR